MEGGMGLEAPGGQGCQGTQTQKNQKPQVAGPAWSNQCALLRIWPTGVAAGRAVPPDVREEPGRALFVHHCLTQ